MLAIGTARAFGLLHAAKASLGGLLEEDPQILEDAKPEASHAAADLALEELKARLLDGDGVLPPDTFLQKCLAFQSLNLDVAERTALGFLRFRGQAAWPWRVPAADVALPMGTELHWLLYARGADSLAACESDKMADSGPAACLAFNMARLDPALCSLEDYQKLTMFLMENATDRPEVQRRGVAAIVDFRGVQLSKLLGAVRVEDVYRGVGFWKGAFPCRLRRVWLVQPPLALQFALRAILQLLSPKLRDRVRVVSSAKDIDGIADELDGFGLPPEFGGSTPVGWQAEAARYLASAPSGTAATPRPQPRTGGAGADPADDRWDLSWCCFGRGAM
mmetsp:Transcript_68974/g.193519  ORF Transcript_68974/g.193519 Transcript_68974/m.193519 type:complete len:334 (+) Transcript_68974:75-1076(+)